MQHKALAVEVLIDLQESLDTFVMPLGEEGEQDTCTHIGELIESIKERVSRLLTGLQTKTVEEDIDEA